jgi:hypothetical protein
MSVSDDELFTIYRMISDLHLNDFHSKYFDNRFVGTFLQPEQYYESYKEVDSKKVVKIVYQTDGGNVLASHEVAANSSTI